MIATEHPAAPVDFTSVQVARLLGVSVRSVQLMVDRGELEAWKTSGGHRRISRVSVDRWRRSRHAGRGQGTANAVGADGADGADGASAGGVHEDDAAAQPSVARTAGVPRRPCVLLIDDSSHFQKLASLLMRQRFPHAELHVADDGIAGLALCGRLQPDVLIVDILLPGIDGATLITSLRSHAQFSNSRLAVVTSLDEPQRAPYAFALEGLPVIHKPRLVAELPPLLATWLGAGATVDAPAPECA